MLETIAPPFWHPAVKGAFILDWDGVLADTKLDFSALRQRYFGGRIVPLIEAAEAFPPPVREEIRDEVRRVEIESTDSFFARPHARLQAGACRLAQPPAFGGGKAWARLWAQAAS